MDGFVQFCVNNGVNIKDKKYNGFCLVDIALKKYQSAVSKLEPSDKKAIVVKAFLNVIPEESREKYLLSI